FVGGEIAETCRQRKRGVIYQDVDPSEAFERAARDLVGGTVRRNVARHGEGALAYFLRQRLRAFAVADVHRDRGAALVQARCGSPSEAAPRTRNDGDAPRKISVFHPENFVPEFSARSMQRTARSRSHLRFAERSDECRSCQVSSGVEHGRERVGNGVDRNEYANAFGGESDREEKRREQDECAARDSGRKAEEHRSKGDHGETGASRAEIEPRIKTCCKERYKRKAE